MQIIICITGTFVKTAQLQLLYVTAIVMIEFVQLQAINRIYRILKIPLQDIRRFGIIILVGCGSDAH